MRLKSLDLVGFKSFSESTLLTFSPGITAVVGPNGCGKSNVVDAIRWVLGEQAPTRLRGKVAEDLIYAGNDSTQPAGMAEVSLLLEAETDHALPEPYSALSEIAVTRRLYRSGESDYLINRIPCRLKDITEFFMAAQIHSRGYALIEQGRVEEIIQAKPAEIRAMVEEAAGLALFKGRREMSERKLERVRENLARVEDVVAEIERQLNYARRQARKAESYKIIREELSGLEKLAAARRILSQRDDLAEQSAREQDLRAQLIELRSGSGALQTQVDESAAALSASRDQLAQIKRELDTIRSAFEERSRTRAFLDRRLKALAELAPNTELRLTELDSKVTVARAARAFTGARLAREQNSDDGATQTQLTLLREQHRATERKLRETEKQTEELKDELAEVMREAAAMRGRLGALAGERADLEERAQSLDQSAPQLAEAMSRCQQQLDDGAAALTAARSAVVQAEGSQRETAEREMALRTALANDASRLAATQETLRTLKARSERIIPNGAGEKLRMVLQSLNGEGPHSAPAMLLDVIKAPPALEPALRAVLGEHLDAVITDSPHFALRAIDILKENESGRLSFIPNTLPAQVPHHPIQAEGIAGRLLDMVEVEAHFVPTAEGLLGHVFVADDLHAAMAASNLNGRGSAFVTPGGDLLWPGRVISGGSGQNLESADEIDIRKREQALVSAAGAVRVAEATHEELVRLDEWARLACDDALAALHSARQRAASIEASVNQYRGALAKAEQNLALAEANRANIGRRVTEVTTATAAANARLEELARKEQELRSRLGGSLEELASRRNETRQLGDTVLEMGTRIEARKAALQALKQELGHQRQLAEELEGQIVQHRIELERARNERSEFERELSVLLAQDSAALEDRRRLEGELQELLRLCEEHALELDRVSKRAGEAQAELTTLEAELMQCELKRERARTLIEELVRNFQEKFQAEFGEHSEALETALTGRDFAKDDERLQELRARAEKMGEVNLAAESEVKELEERAGKLTAERADLQSAVNDLTQTIHKLNREARKRFAETFEGAARNFAELFPKLLRGGKGRLELTAADDVLEAGIQILVQPAGKKVKEIGLLSGGEKAMSAMALIFALFLLNPSPFCVMDEVDAPLDEFSLAAFTSLMQELKARSQFIIITHNQRTMQAADHIHGVTMERPGVSRIISMKIPEAA
jgi:chromosome segregation protein